MASLCANEAALMSYERQIDREELRDQAIESRMEASMAPGKEYDPFDYGNALDAFNEAPMDLQKLVFAEIAANPSHPMHKFIHNYWAKYALQDAEYEVDNSDDNDDCDEPDFDPIYR